MSREALNEFLDIHAQFEREISKQESKHSDLECLTPGCENPREDWRFCWVCNERKDG